MQCARHDVISEDILMEGIPEGEYSGSEHIQSTFFFTPKNHHCFFLIIIFPIERMWLPSGSVPTTLILFIKLCPRILEHMWVWKWGRAETAKHGSFFTSSLLVLISDTYLLTSLCGGFVNSAKLPATKSIHKVMLAEQQLSCNTEELQHELSQGLNLLKLQQNNYHDSVCFFNLIMVCNVL